MNEDSMEFLLEIICLNKQKMGHEVNLDEYLDVGTHWIALYCENIEIIYFGSFGVEHAPEEIEKFIGYKNIKTNIFKIQSKIQ